MLRCGLVLPLALIVVVLFALVVANFDWLDERFLAGPLIVVLLQDGIGVLGIYGQLAADFHEPTPLAVMLRQMLVWLGYLLALSAVELVGMWILVLVFRGMVASFLPEPLAATLFIIVFLGAVQGLIKLLEWLGDRGII